VQKSNNRVENQPADKREWTHGKKVGKMGVNGKDHHERTREKDQNPKKKKPNKRGGEAKKIRTMPEGPEINPSPHRNREWLKKTRRSGGRTQKKKKNTVQGEEGKLTHQKKKVGGRKRFYHKKESFPPA